MKMKIRFLGSPIEDIDRLISELENGEYVKISVSTHKREVFSHPGGEGDTLEEVQTGGWSCTIRSSKDLIQFVDDKDDEYDVKKKDEFSNSVKEKYR
jgi:hypothetical protein